MLLIHQNLLNLIHYNGKVRKPIIAGLPVFRKFRIPEVKEHQKLSE